jgi:hypothetical protein
LARGYTMMLPMPSNTITDSMIARKPEPPERGRGNPHKR